MTRTLFDHTFDLGCLNAAATLVRQNLSASVIAINAQDKELGSLLPVMRNVDSVESIILVGNPKQLDSVEVTRVISIIRI